MERTDGFQERTESRMKNEWDEMTFERERTRHGRRLVHLMFEEADTQQEMEDYEKCWGNT